MTLSKLPNRVIISRKLKAGNTKPIEKRQQKDKQWSTKH